MGQAGTLSLAGVLSLVGVLAGDNGVQPAGTPLTLDLGGTVPPGWDALSHNRGLDVSVGAAVGFGGVGWGGEDVGAARVVGSHPVPASLVPAIAAGISPGFPSAAGFLVQKPHRLPGRRIPVAGMGWGTRCRGRGQGWG